MCVSPLSTWGNRAWGCGTWRGAGSDGSLEGEDQCLRALQPASLVSVGPREDRAALRRGPRSAYASRFVSGTELFSPSPGPPPPRPPCPERGNHEHKQTQSSPCTQRFLKAQWPPLAANPGSTDGPTSHPHGPAGASSGKASGPCLSGDSCQNGRGALYSENGAAWPGGGCVIVSGRRLLPCGAFPPSLPFASRTDLLGSDRSEETPSPFVGRMTAFWACAALPWGPPPPELAPAVCLSESLHSLSPQPLPPRRCRGRWALEGAP